MSKILWRLQLSNTGFFVGEDRDVDAKTVTFFCLNASTGEALWQGIKTEESWWIGIETIGTDTIFLHTFAKPDMPEHKKIIALDLGTGANLWTNDTCAFLAHHSPYVYGYRNFFERRLYYEINEKTGEIQREMTELPQHVEPDKNQRFADILHPEILTEDSPEKMLLDPVLDEVEGTKESRRMVEFLSVSRLLVVNIHLLSVHDPGQPQPQLSNVLFILDAPTKKKLYTDVLNASTPYPVPDSFFVSGTALYYIKERKEIVCLELGDLEDR